MEVKNEADLVLADALIQLDKSKTRENLAAVLDLVKPDWRVDGVSADWVKERGVEAASDAMLRRYLT